MQTESELIARIVEGDLSAFRLLVRRYEKLVVQVTRRVVQDPEAEQDVRQEAFIRIYRKLHTFRHESKLSTWIARVAYTTAVNYVQSNAGKKAVTTELLAAEKSFIQAADPENLLIQKDTAAYVRQQVDRLPLPYRTILTLYHMNELSYQEIGEITGMPEGTVKNYLFRARALLKDKLKHYKR